MKKKISIVMSLLLILCLITIFPAYATKENMYEDLLVERLDIARESAGGELIYWYEELFYYYSDDNQSTPDYVLVKASTPIVSDAFHSSDFGEYVIITAIYHYPYDHAYHIYTPADDKVYTLEEAYYAEIEGLEEALKFLNGTVVALIGDADANFTLNIKDATRIQKTLANYKDLPVAHEWDELAIEACDFNRDGDINIRDVTAIQKHLAKIEI
ncbi:MAG: dockerin type I repeat-containing protein [Ruminococcus sp.]|nr:dockerin type I repeat-containing protein [Ruminococcus sp.]